MYQLSCRAHPAGRGLVPVAAAPGSSDPATAGLDRWTLFIHGFNNSNKAAAAVWRDTVEHLRGRANLGAVVLFYWPGDYSRNDVISAMNYPSTVPIAEDTARLLAKYLQLAAQNRRLPLHISFVAHSLGSVVVLETINLLRSNRANVMVNDVLLMAAAVPEGYCREDERYGAPFSPEAKEKALYSLDDRTLKRYFQVGQQIANRVSERGRRAVGRTGGPGAGPGQRWWASIHLDSFDHGDYWRKPASIAEIARILPSHRVNAIPTSDNRQRQNRRDGLCEDTLPTDVLDEDDYLSAGG